MNGEGRLDPGPVQTLAIEQQHQIANYADFCNECGNCDTFCPKYGGPFIEKPNFFGTLKAFRTHAQWDGFHIEAGGSMRRIHGRIKGKNYLLEHDQGYLFTDGITRASLSDSQAQPDLIGKAPADHVIDMRVFHTMRLLLDRCLIQAASIK